MRQISGLFMAHTFIMHWFCCFLTPHLEKYPLAVNNCFTVYCLWMQLFFGAYSAYIVLLAGSFFDMNSLENYFAYAANLHGTAELYIFWNLLIAVPTSSYGNCSFMCFGWVYTLIICYIWLIHIIPCCNLSSRMTAGLSWAFTILLMAVNRLGIADKKFFSRNCWLLFLLMEYSYMLHIFPCCCMSAGLKWSCISLIRWYFCLFIFRLENAVLAVNKYSPVYCLWLSISSMDDDILNGLISVLLSGAIHNLNYLYGIHECSYWFYYSKSNHWMRFLVVCITYPGLKYNALLFLYYPKVFYKGKFSWGLLCNYIRYWDGLNLEMSLIRFAGYKAHLSINNWMLHSLRFVGYDGGVDFTSYWFGSCSCDVTLLLKSGCSYLHLPQKDVIEPEPFLTQFLNTILTLLCFPLLIVGITLTALSFCCSLMVLQVYSS